MAVTDEFWAITSYFNPLGYKTRRENYRLFRQRLSVPLIAIELAYESAFELGDADADILIQVRGGDVMWQKERLLNLARAALPPSCSKVAVLDCDVFFRRGDWAEQASKLLDRVAIAHLYRGMHYLPAGATSAIGEIAFAEPMRVSIISAVASGLDAETCLEAGNGPKAGYFGTGLAWAVQREILDLHPAYDAFILGGGARAMIAGIYNCFDHLTRRMRLNETEVAHFREWADPFRRTVGDAIGYLDGDIFHLWHGSLENRRWYARYEPMPRFRFNPYEDIALTENGLWRWNSDKPDLHGYVREHFARRREDG